MCYGPLLIWWMKYVSIYRICMGFAWEWHIVLLYEWLQNYLETKEPIGREWCKILQKSENIQSISIHNANCCPLTDVVFVWKDLNTMKQHVENISQMYGKNSWGFCQRSNQKKTGSAHPFEGARYWFGCSRSTLPCHLLERLHWRGWQTPGNHQRHSRASFQQDHIKIIFNTSFSMLRAESSRDKEITMLRKHCETGTLHASFLYR